MSFVVMKLSSHPMKLHPSHFLSRQQNWWYLMSWNFPWNSRWNCAVRRPRAAGRLRRRRSWMPPARNSTTASFQKAAFLNPNSALEPGRPGMKPRPSGRWTCSSEIHLGELGGGRRKICCSCCPVAIAGIRWKIRVFWVVCSERCMCMYAEMLGCFWILKEEQLWTEHGQTSLLKKETGAWRHPSTTSRGRPGLTIRDTVRSGAGGWRDRPQMDNSS